MIMLPAAGGGTLRLSLRHRAASVPSSATRHLATDSPRLEGQPCHASLPTCTQRVTREAGTPPVLDALRQEPRSVIGAVAACLATFRAERTEGAIGRAHGSAGRLRSSIGLAAHRMGGWRRHRRLPQYAISASPIRTSESPIVQVSLLNLRRRPNATGSAIVIPPARPPHPLSGMNRGLKSDPRLCPKLCLSGPIGGVAEEFASSSQVVLVQCGDGGRKGPENVS